MATLELVEKLRTRANVSYDEAKEALDSTGDDLLEAMIYLEKKGKVPPPQGEGYYSSCPPPPPKQNPKEKNNKYGKYAGYDYENKPRGESPGSVMRKFFAWLRDLLHKGNTNLFNVHKCGRLVISIPVTVLLILLIIGFWVVVTLLIIGLFCGYCYSFKGQEIEKTIVNKVMDSASEAANNLKTEFDETVNKAEAAKNQNEDEKEQANE